MVYSHLLGDLLIHSELLLAALIFAINLEKSDLNLAFINVINPFLVLLVAHLNVLYHIADALLVNIEFCPHVIFFFLAYFERFIKCQVYFKDHLFVIGLNKFGLVVFLRWL